MGFLYRRIDAAEQEADLVLGSRYVAGGSVTDWGLVRRLVSRGERRWEKIMNAFFAPWMATRLRESSARMA